MPNQVEIINVNNPSFDFYIKNLNINFVGLSVSNPNTIYNTSIRDTLYVLNKNTKSVLFNDFKLKDAVLRNRHLTANDKNLITTNVSTEQEGDYIKIEYAFDFKNKTIGILEIKYPYSYYTKENTVILPFQSFPIQAIYTVMDPGVLINHYYGQSLNQLNKKTGIMDINFIISCGTKDGVQINEDTTISVNLINGGFVRPVGGGGVVDSGSGSGAGRLKAWRPMMSTATCEVNVMSPATIYGKLEIVDVVSFDDYFPDHIEWSDRFYGERGTLKLSFYSDSGFTTPVTLTNQTVRVFVHSQNIETIYTTGDEYRNSVQIYSIQNVTGEDVILAENVTVTRNVEQNHNYNTGESVMSESVSSNEYTYTLFPTTQITGGQTGNRLYGTLEQYYTDNATNTGLTKPNSPSDPDYIPPSVDTVNCKVEKPITGISLGTTIKLTSLSFTTNGVTDTPLTPYLPYTADTGSAFVIYKRSGITSVLVNVDYTGSAGSTPGYVRAYLSFASGATQTINVPRNSVFSLGSFSDLTHISFSKW